MQNIDEMIAPSSLVGSRIGSYRIEAIEASGRATTLYRARNIPNGSLAALTAIHTEFLSEQAYGPFMNHFMQVGAQLFSLSHPHVVRLLDYGEHAGYAYLLSEYPTASESLARRLKREPRLTLDEIIPLFSQLCSGLQYAHDHGILHGHLKPSAILLHKNGLQVIGLGMVNILETHPLPQRNIFLGDPLYLAPERLQGHEVSVQSDVYALGILLSELVRTTTPFSAATEASFACLHGQQSIPSFASRGPEGSLSRSLDALLHVALAPLPEQRFRSISNLWKAYEMLILKGETQTLQTLNHSLEEMDTARLSPLPPAKSLALPFSPIPIPSTGALTVLPPAPAEGLDQATASSAEVLVTYLQEMVWDGSMRPQTREESVFSLPLPSLSQSGLLHMIMSRRGALIGLFLCLLLLLSGLGIGAWMAGHGQQNHHFQTPAPQSHPVLPQQQPQNTEPNLLTQVDHGQNNQRLSSPSLDRSKTHVSGLGDTHVRGVQSTSATPIQQSFQWSESSSPDSTWSTYRGRSIL